MHEFSLVRSLCRQVLEILRRDESGGVASPDAMTESTPPRRESPSIESQPLASARPLPQVREIKVRCGPLSGVEPLLMREAFETLRQDSPLADAELVIVEERLWAKCLDCDEPFEPERFRLFCPLCGSGHTQIDSGDSVILESVLVDSEPIRKGV